MKHKVLLTALIIFLGSVSGVISVDTFEKTIANIQTGMYNAAGVFFVDSITVSSLHANYKNADKVSVDVNGQKVSDKIKILIVPGHEPNYGGTEYRNLKERDIVVDIADNLATILRTNPRYEVIVARDKNGWNPILDEYFSREWENILEWKEKYKAEMIRLVGQGLVKIHTEGVEHNSAPNDVARRLYGINKWTVENNVDIALHLHINDNPRSNTRNPGKYSGFTIYVPERQYSNAKATGAVADTVSRRLSKYFATSNLPQESDGIVEDQELVAIGRHNTVDAVSMLIEYGYIYEPQYEEKDIRDLVVKEYALSTYLGIQDFFGAPNAKIDGADSFLLSQKWTHGGLADILAVQFILAHKGYYPPSGKTKNECGMTGILGPCTLTALQKFQYDQGISDETGRVGEKTQKALYTVTSIQ